MTPVEAAKLIPDNATIAISGGGYRVAPEALLAALEERFIDDGEPKNLTAIAISMVEQSRGGRGGEGSGINRISRDGMLREVICSSYSRARGRELNDLIYSNKVFAHDMPMGTVVQWLRAIACGEPGLLTTVGLDTFIDPRQEGGCMNQITDQPLSKVVEVDGHEMLFYPRREIDVALVKGTTIDERGNVYLEREAFTHGILYIAMAAKNSGGIVIAQANRIAHTGTVHPRMGRVPGGLVDVGCIVPDVWEDEQEPVLTGEIREVLARSPLAKNPRTVIANRALKEIPSGSVVNLGAGIPMYEIPNAAHFNKRDDIYFTIEQGPMGGLPRVGGVSRNPEIILDQLEVFDYYQGGGPDLTCLAFGQIDRSGNVNVSKFGEMMPGCGGFTNIVHAIPKLLFCGTLTTGGLQEEIGNGELRIEKEGRIKRFVEQVEQITMNGERTLARGQEVMIITERAVFDLTSEGFVLNEIAPGVELERDIMRHIDFPVHVSTDLQTMDKALFE